MYTVIKSATCTSTSSTCNSMLKAQMLATALDVYFSDPSLAGTAANNAYKPFNNNKGPLGGVVIDLSAGCSMVDASPSSGSCASPEDWSQVFKQDGTTTNWHQFSSVSGCGFTTIVVSSSPPNHHGLSVSCMLTVAASYSNVGGTTWYILNSTYATNPTAAGQKSPQVIAKDAFDAVNNQVAFAP